MPEPEPQKGTRAHLSDLSIGSDHFKVALAQPARSHGDNHPYPQRPGVRKSAVPHKYALRVPSTNDAKALPGCQRTQISRRLFIKRPRAMGLRVLDDAAPKRSM